MWVLCIIIMGHGVMVFDTTLIGRWMFELYFRTVEGNILAWLSSWLVAT